MPVNLIVIYPIILQIKTTLTSTNHNVCYKLARKDMYVNEHERLSNITLRPKLKQRNSAFIAVLHFKFTVGSSTMSLIHNLK